MNEKYFASACWIYLHLKEFVLVRVWHRYVFLSYIIQQNIQNSRLYTNSKT